MAKTDMTEVKIVDNDTKAELVYNAKKTPSTSTVGHNLFGTLNSVGMAVMQANGYEVYDDESYIEVIKSKFPFLTDDMIGKRGAKWDTEEARAKYSVYFGGAKYEPALKDKEEKEVSVKTEQVVEESKEPAVADNKTISVTDALKSKIVPQIVNYIKNGQSDDLIIKSLSEAVGEQSAIVLLESAKEELKPKIVVSQPKEIDFNFSKINQPSQPKESVILPNNFNF